MFSEKTRRYFENARGFGRLAHPTHQSSVGRPEAYFELQLCVDPSGRVTDLAFQCPRCVPAIACGAYLHQQLVGQFWPFELTVAQVVESLGGLPPQRIHYAWLAVEALSRVRATR